MITAKLSAPKREPLAWAKRVGDHKAPSGPGSRLVRRWLLNKSEEFPRADPEIMELYVISIHIYIYMIL